MRHILVIIIILAISCADKKPAQTGMEGKPLPDFTLLLPDSTQKFNTKSISQSFPFVVFLFLPDCPHCKSQMKEIVSNMDKLKNLHFYLVTPSSFKEMKQFYHEYRLSDYSNVTVGNDITNFYSQYIGAPGVPLIALYDKNKILNKAFLGKIDMSQINDLLVK